MSSATGFVDVLPEYAGGEGVPVPSYHCTYKGETLTIFPCGKGLAAAAWLAGRDWRHAVYAVIDGVWREVARGR